MALSLRDQGEIVGRAGAAASPTRELDFVIQIWTVDGRSIYASRPHASLPARALLGLATLKVDGRAWRTYSVATRERVIQVAQPVEIRQRLAAHAAWRSVLPLLLMAPLAGARDLVAGGAAPGAAVPPRRRAARARRPVAGAARRRRPARRAGAAGAVAQCAARAPAPVARRAAGVRRRCGARAALAAHRVEAAARAAARAPATTPTARPRAPASAKASSAPPAWSSSCWRWRAASRAPRRRRASASTWPRSRAGWWPRRCRSRPRARIELELTAPSAGVRRRRPGGARPAGAQPGRQRRPLFAAGLAGRGRGRRRRGRRRAHGRRRRPRHPGGRAASASSTASTGAPRAASPASGLGLAIVQSVASSHGADGGARPLAAGRPARDGPLRCRAGRRRLNLRLIEP